MRRPFDRVAVSKALSRIASARVADILNLLAADDTRRARVVAVTGAPGAGKSTLIARLAPYRLRHARSLAVIAIDPTSPLSGGSVLGDRIRMDALSEDPRVLIRSLPSRAAEDGLTDNLAEVVATLDMFGFDDVMIETVGVGQTAYGARALADIVVLVLTPGAGDYVQAMKAGIMEVADAYVINKSDQPGSERLIAELSGVLLRVGDKTERPLVQVRAGDDTGIVELSGVLDQQFARASESAVAAARRARCRYRVQGLVQRSLKEALDALPETTWDHPIPGIYQQAITGLREYAARAMSIPFRKAK